MRRAWTLLMLGLLLGLGCSDRERIVAPNGQVGKVTLSIPPAPAQITRVVATLSRQGFADLTASLVVVDSTQGATGSFTDVPVGAWHLKVEALDASNVVRFRGEGDVEVLGGQTSEVDLELLPTSGSINIRVRWGRSNLLVNGSFEDGPYPGVGPWLLVAGSTEIAGWVVTPVAINYMGVGWSAADGQRSIDLDGDNPGGIEQSFATVSGRSYVVQFRMAGNPDPDPATRVKSMRVLAAGQHADFSFDTNGRSEQDMGWVMRTWSFTADSTTTTLEFQSLSPDPNSARGAALDNVVVSTASSTSSLLAFVSIDPNGSERGGPDGDIYTMLSDGTNKRRLTDDNLLDGHPALSPDGTKIAWQTRHDAFYQFENIWVMTVDGTARTQLTTDSGVIDAAPAWSHDGAKIAFVSDRDLHSSPEGREIYVMNADGSSQTRLTNNAYWDDDPTWSPDGRIAFRSIRNGVSSIWIMDANGSNERQLTTGDGAQPAWSPDGQWIAFVSHRDGYPNVYRIRPDGSALSRLTADAAEDSRPTWAPTSSQIAFASKRNAGVAQVFVMNSDGTNPVQITTLPTDTVDPGWGN